MIYITLLVIGIIFGVLAQLALKQGMNKANIISFRGTPKKELCKKIFCNQFIIYGFILYGLSSLLWLVIMSELELSYAYPMISSGYFFVAFFSMVLFNEKISFKRWASIFIIMIGVVIIGLS